MFRFLIVLSVFLSFGSLYAFPKMEADRFLVVQFSKPVEPQVINELSAYSFLVLEPLNVEKTLYKIGYSSKMHSEARADQILRKLPFFQASQEDGPIKFRNTTPNDSLFSKQWHHDMIKATEAWDISQSEVNGRGDTIVIAVIDDGLHINHPDFQGNIWINYADTAGNGIDDDNNGYVDDHYGWNFVNNNNDISDSTFYEAKHGTPVAGIIGARGNNITGVSGIMWKVKLMIVNIADTSPIIEVYQSDAIRAYSYVLNQRKLYNASGGQKGAFVVASNSSWGANDKFPHQAPLWCAMYDSLGKHGILNVSAVTNTLGVIEATGDIPSLCPSNHLIVVGSTTKGDNFFDCGYSTKHVDLSAPGHSIFSTKAYTSNNILINNLYNDLGHSGTSFSAPMVTAAVGILHSYACGRVLDSIKANPAKGNLMMRKFILEGVDTLQSLNGKSVTSGRLNIRKSMRIMDLYCAGLVGVNPPAIPQVQLYPNPGNGYIRVLTGQPIISIACYDLAGKLISSEFDGEQLMLTDIADGVYLIRIGIGETILTFRYVKADGF